MSSGREHIKYASHEEAGPSARGWLLRAEEACHRCSGRKEGSCQAFPPRASLAASRMSGRQAFGPRAAIHRRHLSLFHPISEQTASSRSDPADVGSSPGSLSLLWGWGSVLILRVDSHTHKHAWHTWHTPPTAPRQGSCDGSSCRSPRLRLLGEEGTPGGLLPQADRPFLPLPVYLVPAAVLGGLPPTRPHESNTQDPTT